MYSSLGPGVPGRRRSVSKWKPEFGRRGVVESARSKPAALLDKNHDPHRPPSEDATGLRFFRSRSVLRGISAMSPTAATIPTKVAGWWKNLKYERSVLPAQNRIGGHGLKNT